MDEHNELNLDELIVTKEGDKVPRAKFDFKNLTAQQKLIGLLAVLVLLIGIGFGGYKYYEFCDTVDYVVRNVTDMTVREFEGEEEWWYDDYLEVKDSKRFAKKLNAALTTLLVPTEEKANGNYYQVIHTGKILDMMGWNNEEARATVLTACNISKEYNLSKEDDGLTYLASDLSYLQDMNYYPAMTDVFTKDDAVAYMAPAKENLLKKQDLDTLTAFMVDVSRALRYCSFLDAVDFISTDEILDIVTANTEPAVFENGKGGYYDGKHEDSSSRRVNSKNVTYTHRYSYSYFGDFMIKHHTKDVSSPYLNAEGNANMKQFNTSSTTMYYKGESINGHTQNFRTLLGGGSLVERYNSNAAPGSDVAVSMDSFYENSGDAQVLGVLVNLEEDFICVVKNNGIAVLTNSTELAYDKVDVTNYELTPVLTEQVFVDRPAAVTTPEKKTAHGDALKALQDAFEEYTPQLIGYYPEENRLVVILPTPEGVGGVLVSGEQTAVAEDMFNTFATETTTIFAEIMAEHIEAGYDGSYMLIFVSDADPDRALFASLNGEVVTAVFGTDEEIIPAP